MAFTALWKRLRPAQLLASSSPIWTSRAAPRSVSIRLQASFGLSSVSSLAGLLALQDTSKHLAAAEDKHRWRLRSRARTNFKRPLHHSNDCRQLRRLLLAQRSSTHSVQPVPQSSLRNNAAPPMLQSAARGAPQRPEKKKKTSGTSCDAPRCTPVIDGSY